MPSVERSLPGDGRIPCPVGADVENVKTVWPPPQNDVGHIELPRVSEAIYRAIGESIDYGVWVCAPDGRNLYASESFLRLVGITQEQCSNFGWGDVLHPADRERTISAWKKCCREGRFWDIEHRYLGVDGEYHAVLARGVPVRDDGGRIICWAGINLDIDRARKTEEALRASESRMRLVSDIVARLLAASDLQTDLTQIGREVMERLDCQVFFNYLVDSGAELETAITRPKSAAHLRLNACAGIDADLARQIEQLDFGVAVCGTVARDNCCITLGDINERDDAMTALVRDIGVRAYCCHPLRSGDRVIGTLSFGTTSRANFSDEDVALMRTVADEMSVAVDRMSTLRELQVARFEAVTDRNRLISVMESLPIGVCILDQDGGIARTNDAFEKVWKGPRPPVENVGDYLPFRAWRPGETEPLPPEEWASARAVRHGETVVAEELKIQCFDSSLRTVLNGAAPIRDASGTITGAAVAIQDVTEHKQQEEARRKLELQVQQKQKFESLGVLAGGIAHDFNNLLTVILGSVELASGATDTNTRTSHQLAVAKQAAEQAAELCQQMLVYAGKTPLAFVPCALNNLLQEMRSLVGAALPKQARLHMRLAPSLPPVRADMGMLRQVVMNLLINASEALENGSGDITITTGISYFNGEGVSGTHPRDALRPGNYVYLDVKDTGSGMDAKTAALVFDPFFSTKFAGRGLGLASVLGIVRSHDGTVQLKSTPGGGSTFRVWLPALAESTGELTTKGAPAPRGASRRHITGTVLVVDDEAPVRFVAAQLLERLGLETIAASDGLEAIEIFAANQEQISCVLLDVTMPRMGGAETYRELVRICGSVRVAMCSGYAKEDVIESVRDVGAPLFLQKPFGLRALEEVILALRA